MDLGRIGSRTALAVLDGARRFAALIVVAAHCCRFGLTGQGLLGVDKRGGGHVSLNVVQASERHSGINLEIEYLRAVAVLLVVFVHLGALLPGLALGQW